jgi:hypothetical protein
MDSGADAFQYGFSALLNNGIYGMDNEEMVAEPGYTALCVFSSSSVFFLFFWVRKQT